MCSVLYFFFDGDVVDFEASGGLLYVMADIALFIKVLRWWKEWLALPPLPSLGSAKNDAQDFDPFAANPLRI